MCQRQEIIGAGLLLLLQRPFQMRDCLVPFLGIEKGNPYIQHIAGLHLAQCQPGLRRFEVLFCLKQAVAQKPPALIIGGRTFQLCLQQTDRLGQVVLLYQLFGGQCRAYRSWFIRSAPRLLRSAPRTFFSFAHVEPPCQLPLATITAYHKLAAAKAQEGIKRKSLEKPTVLQKFRNKSELVTKTSQQKLHFVPSLSLAFVPL